MENVQLAVQALVSAIKNSDEYKNLNAAASALSGRDGDIRNITEYKKTLVSQEIKRLNGEAETEDDERALAELHRRLSLDKDSVTYLMREKLFIKLMAEVYETLGKNFNEPTAFFDEM